MASGSLEPFKTNSYFTKQWRTYYLRIRIYINEIIPAVPVQSVSNYRVLVNLGLSMYKRSLSRHQQYKIHNTHYTYPYAIFFLLTHIFFTFFRTRETRSQR